MIEAGPSYMVLIKASNKSISYSKSHAVNWLAGHEQPILIGIADVEDCSLSLYSTWRMQQAFLLHGTPEEIRLVPSSQTKEDNIRLNKKTGRINVYLGEPVVSLSISELGDRKVIDQRRKLLHEWIRLDRDNLVRKEAKTFWLIGPRVHNTNQEIPHAELQELVYINEKNIDSNMDNLVRACIAVIRDISKHNAPSADHMRIKSGLCKFLNSYSSLFSRKQKKQIDHYLKKIL